MKKNTILTNYKESMIKKIKMFRPNLSDEKIEKIVKMEMKKRIKDFNVSFEGDNYSAIRFIDLLEDKKPIITPFGAIYLKHDEQKNELAAMVDMLLKERKVAKKKMFSHQNDEDKTLFNNFKMVQLTLKLLANSFYGASIEKNSIFYHPYFGPSITYSGRRIIQTAVNAFEKFVGVNIIFRTNNDIINYIFNIIEEEVTQDIIVNDKTSDEVYNYLLTKLDRPINVKKDIKILLDGLTQLQLNKIYYKNNLNEIISNSDTVKDLISNIVAKDDFLDPNSPPEHYQEITNQVWDIFKEWVYYDNIDFYNSENAEEKTRNAVLTIDTDSNFIYLQRFVDNCFKEFGIEDTPKNRMTTTNVGGWLMSKVIAANYWKMCEHFNIPDDKKPIINMKNEFYYSRIMLTRNKKNYGGLVAMQEGNILNEKDLDIKGLAIKKVTVVKEIRDYFKDLLEEDILKPDKISLSKVISKYQKLENRIRESVVKGETIFVKPDKVNLVSTYKTPYQIQAVRGTLLWNHLYPNEEISVPNKINIVKTTLDTIEDIQNSNIPDDIKNAIFKLFEEVPELEKYGASVLGIPKTLEQLPDWVVPYIDVDVTVNDNMAPGKILLESLGFKDLTVNRQQIATNILDL